MSDKEQTQEIRTILILKSNPLSLQSAEQFLRARDWNIISTTSLAEAIQKLFTTKVDYFLLCANHPHKKIRVLPKILSQATSLNIMAYTDIASTFNMSILNEMGVPYQIVPPVSGPAIERTIFRIQKDLQAQKDNPKGPAKAGAQNASGMLDASFQEKFKNLFIGEGEDSGSGMDFAFSQSGTSKDDPESFMAYEERMRQSQTHGSAVGIQSKTTYPSPFAGIGSSDSEQLPPPKPAFTNIRKSPTALEKSIENVLESAVGPTDPGKPVRKIGKAQDCICLSISSDQYRGYLVAAMGQNRRFDDELLLNIQSHLADLFKQEGIPVDEDEPMEIRVRLVDFEAWALEKAEFLKKSLHNGNEVAMAFFLTEKISPQFGESQAKDMVSIDIDDLATDQEVTFDVYVFLPANNKYILYTPKGGIFLKAQKVRLKSKGVDRMHIKKESAPDAKKYHAANTLNNSIEDFETKAAIEAAIDSEEERAKKKA